VPVTSGNCPTRFESYLVHGAFGHADHSITKMLKPLNLFLQQNTSPEPALRSAETPSIYVVDNEEDLTKLYTIFLEASGCTVRTFNDRAEALIALQTDQTKPDLLITDYLGPSLPIDGFMRRCRIAHPTLRILMASGFGRADVGFSQASPDRFIQKPFTPEEFREEVRATLAFS